VIIRLVNTTTRLPVDHEIENIFFRTIHPAFKADVESKSRHHAPDWIDVFLVDEQELDLERKNTRDPEVDDPDQENSMDLLGVYVSPCHGVPRPVIKVSPEKVMAYCVRLKEKNSFTLPLEQLYPVFLVGVVVHELAHLIMDDSSNCPPHVMPWKSAAKWLDDCPESGFLSQRYHTHHADRLHPSVRGMRDLVEESLANAFVLKQRVRGEALHALKTTMASEPPGYRQGLLWSGGLRVTLETAQAWARFKRELEASRWQFVFSEAHNPLQELVDRLRSGQSIVSANLQRNFYRHLANRIGDWQTAYEGDKPAWNEHLNETFGAYATLVTWGHFYGISAKTRLKFLRQWASNGSAEAVDKLHETLALAAKAEGKYQRALTHQCERLKNLPRLEMNEYWNKRYETEINASIAAMESLIEKGGSMSFRAKGGPIRAAGQPGLSSNQPTE